MVLFNIKDMNNGRIYSVLKENKSSFLCADGDGIFQNIHKDNFYNSFRLTNEEALPSFMKKPSQEEVLSYDSDTDIRVIEKGTIVKINGLPFQLEEDVKLSSHPNNWAIIYPNS